MKPKNQSWRNVSFWLNKGKANYLRSFKWITVEYFSLSSSACYCFRSIFNCWFVLSGFSCLPVCENQTQMYYVFKFSVHPVYISVYVSLHHHLECNISRLLSSHHWGWLVVQWASSLDFPSSVESRSSSFSSKSSSNFSRMEKRC